MHLLVISDIFGRTKALEALCRNLTPKTEIIDPYQGKDMGFDSEADAYSHFMHHAGIDAYTLKIRKALDRHDGDLFILAFSVGAACVWKLSAFPPECRVKKAFCFYGSQIRNFSSLTPKFDIELIFPREEFHFDVDKLIAMIQSRNHVTCSKTKGLHGFMNERSLNFDAGILKFYTDYLNRQMSVTPAFQKP